MLPMLLVHVSLKVVQTDAYRGCHSTLSETPTHFLPFMCSTMGVSTDKLCASLRSATGPNTMPGLIVTSSHLQYTDTSMETGLPLALLCLAAQSTHAHQNLSALTDPVIEVW